MKPLLFAYTILLSAAYLKDSARFQQRRQRIDSIKNIIYGVPQLVYTPRQLQKLKPLLEHHCFIKPDEFL